MICMTTISGQNSTKKHKSNPEAPMANSKQESMAMITSKTILWVIKEWAEEEKIGT